MKKLFLITILLLAACSVSTAHADQRVTLLLSGGPGNDAFGVKLSQDGRSYLIDSLSPLEADGSVCVRDDGSDHDLICKATAIGGFEVNGGSGEDSVVISSKVQVPATLRGGPDEDRLRGAGAADKLVGGPGDDVLLGHGGSDWLFGGSGDDRLFGGTGEDRLEGGPGTDYLQGGPGADAVKAGPSDQAGPEPQAHPKL
jgi:Ca2+-binding RTX toxin-like protein